MYIYNEFCNSSENKATLDKPNNYHLIKNDQESTLAIPITLHPPPASAPVPAPVTAPVTAPVPAPVPAPVTAQYSPLNKDSTQPMIIDEVCQTKQMDQTDKTDKMKQLEVAKYLNISKKNLQGLTNSSIYFNLIVEEIDASNNSIMYVGDSLEKLKELRIVRLTNNKLKDIPHNLCSCKLYVLELSSNNISDISVKIINLSELKVLTLSNNKIRDVALLNKLKQLVVLDLSYNFINDITSAIYSMQYLKILLLNNNNITHLTHVICNLKNLEILDVSNNKLTYLLPNIYQLQSLKKFYIHNNCLKDLPYTIIHMRKLVEFTYSGNNFDYKDYVPPHISFFLKTIKKTPILSDSEIYEAGSNIKGGLIRGSGSGSGYEFDSNSSSQEMKISETLFIRLVECTTLNSLVSFINIITRRSTQKTYLICLSEMRADSILSKIVIELIASTLKSHQVNNFVNLSLKQMFHIFWSYISDKSYETLVKQQLNDMVKSPMVRYPFWVSAYMYNCLYKPEIQCNFKIGDNKELENLICQTHDTLIAQGKYSKNEHIIIVQNEAKKNNYHEGVINNHLVFI